MNAPLNMHSHQMTTQSSKDLKITSKPRVVDLSFSHFLCKNLNAVCADYLIIFQDLLRIFFATFFQKQASKDHLAQGNLLETTLLNEKQTDLEKEMYGNISLYSQYFSPGAGINVHKTYFYFLKLMKNYFILSR